MGFCNLYRVPSVDNYMHELQDILVMMAKHDRLNGRSYREIARDLQIPNGSQAKYHIDCLIERGILLRKKNGDITVADKDKIKPVVEKPTVTFHQIPLRGAANCGAATMIAEDRVERLLPVSGRIIGRNTGKWFAVRAVGNSMNKAKVEGLSIEDGDYVLVDSAEKQPKNGDIIVSLIDGLANIKTFNNDRENGQITLVSQSTEEHPPILIHEEDVGSYLVAGKVKHVIKKPKI